jgi:hypothetical protein
MTPSLPGRPSRAADASSTAWPGTQERPSPDTVLPPTPSSITLPEGGGRSPSRRGSSLGSARNARGFAFAFRRSHRLVHPSCWAGTIGELDRNAKAGQMPRADTSASKRPLLRWPPGRGAIAPGTGHGYLDRKCPCRPERRRLLARPGRGQGRRAPSGRPGRRWSAVLGSKRVRHGG